MIRKLRGLLRTVLSGLAWVVAGVLVPASFVGVVWLSRGAYGGYTGVAAAIGVGSGIAWLSRRRATSPAGILWRMLPAALSFIVVIWSMMPMAPRSLEAYPEPPAGFARWDLDDGRMVSVSHHSPPENIVPREEAILFVHGGPGAYVRDFDREFFASFSEHGYEVFSYDQVGGGRSPIVDPAQYTHDANVRDLAAVVGRIERPVILVGQSYGAGVVVSYLDRYGTDEDVRSVILTEPSPVPGKPLPDDPHYAGKTTRAESLEGPGPIEMIDSPRFLLGMVLPADNQFVDQQELINYVDPEKQDRIVAASFCKADVDSIPDFEKLRVNILANRLITDSFWTSAHPDLSTLDVPVMLLMGECSNLPRGFAMDYFDVMPIDRSHVIPGVGHVLWGTERGRMLTRTAIMRFLEGGPMPLPNEPAYDERRAFVEQGR